MFRKNHSNLCPSPLIILYLWPQTTESPPRNDLSLMTVVDELATLHRRNSRHMKDDSELYINWRESDRASGDPWRTCCCYEQKLHVISNICLYVSAAVGLLQRWFISFLWTLGNTGTRRWRFLFYKPSGWSRWTVLAWVVFLTNPCQRGLYRVPVHPRWLYNI